MSANSPGETEALQIARDIVDGGPEGGALGPLNDLSRRKMIDQMIFRAQEEELPVETATARRSISMLSVFHIAAGALIAASLIFGVTALFRYYKETGGSLTHPLSLTEKAVLFGKIDRLDGDMKIGERVAANGQGLPLSTPVAIRTGSALLSLPTGIQIGLHPATEIQLDNADPARLVVTLRRGSILLSVDPARRGPVLAVETSSGRVEVKGTIFRVHIEENQTNVAVLRGTVAVIGKNGTKTLVHAEEKTVMGENTVSIMSDDTVRKELADLSQWGIEAPSTVATADSARNAADHESEEKTSGRRIRKQEVSSIPSIEQMTNAIREHRRARNWREAALAYEQLIREYPSSEAGQAALVALGDLSLNQLNDPAAALSCFENYLGFNLSSLRPEAMYGKALALRALGRHDAERIVLTDFTRSYGQMPQSLRAKERLDELKKNDLR